MPTIVYIDKEFELPVRVYPSGRIDTRTSHRIDISSNPVLRTAIHQGLPQLDQVLMQILLFVQPLQEARDYYWGQTHFVINFKVGSRQFAQYLYLYNESDYLAYCLRFGQ